MPVRFNDVTPGQSLRHPFYGDSVSITDKTEGPNVPSRIFLFAKREVTFYAPEFDALGFDLNPQPTQEDALPTKRYKRLPAWKGKPGKAEDKDKDKDRVTA